MNIDKLLDAASGPGPTFEYYREVVARLEDALGSALNMEQSLDLIDILTRYTFLYDDGFVINDDGDLIRIIGYSDAAAMVAAFWDEPEYDWQWFKAEHLFSFRRDDSKKIRDELLTSILQNPAVKLREYSNERNRGARKHRTRKPPES